MNPAAAVAASKLTSPFAHPMSRLTLPLLILGAVILSALLAWWALSRGFGSEPVERSPQRAALPPFHRIEIGGGADVTLLQADAESIEADGGPHLRITASVADGRLRIRAEDRRRWWNRIFGARVSGTPRITLRFRTLDAVDLSGNVKLRAAKLEVPSLRIDASGGSTLAIDDLRAASLRVSGSGALDARIAGRVGQEVVSISGAGSYHADKLFSDDATVSVSGVGDVVVHAAKTLRANISGAGNIEYVGDPQVTEHVSGIGRVKRRGPAQTAGMQTAQCGGPWSLKNSGPCVVESASS